MNEFQLYDTIDSQLGPTTPDNKYDTTDHGHIKSWHVFVSDEHKYCVCVLELSIRLSDA